MPRKVAKVKDKWREKVWLQVYAPSTFGSVAVAKIPVTDMASASTRTVETTLFDLLKQDPNHYNIKLYLKLDKVEGDNAYTIFKGHEYSREFMRSLIRRGSSMVNYISDYRTKDGYVLRIYVIAFTEGRVNGSKKAGIRKAADKILKEKTSSMVYDQFVQEMVLNKVASDIFNEAKKVTALRHLGIRKSKLILQPSKPEEKVSIPA